MLLARKLLSTSFQAHLPSTNERDNHGKGCRTSRARESFTLGFSLHSPALRISSHLSHQLLLTHSVLHSVCVCVCWRFFKSLRCCCLYFAVRHEPCNCNKCQLAICGVKTMSPRIGVKVAKKREEDRREEGREEGREERRENAVFVCGQRQVKWNSWRTQKRVMKT